MKLPANNAVFNFVGFQLGWFACVLGGAHQLPWLGLLVGLPIIAWHLRGANDARPELVLILMATVLGSLFDQTLLSLGLIEYPASSLPAWLLPIWMSVLWALFVTTLNLSLRWMRGKYIIATLFGLIGGPLAYWGGVRLGAMHLIQPVTISIMLAIGWGVFTPVLVWLSTRLDGYTHLSTPKKEIFIHG